MLFREDGTWATVTFTGFAIRESDFAEAKQFGTFAVEDLDLVMANDPTAEFACEEAPTGRYQVFMNEDGLIRFETIEDDCFSRNALFVFFQDNSLKVFERVD